jgi:hypothetical protein
LAALNITAEVMNWVYSTGTEKPKQVSIIEEVKSKAGFFSSLFGLGGGSTPQRAASPLPPQPIINEADYLKVGQSGVVLTIFTAEVDVKLSQKISAELHRSTKKNPPRALKYELIYVCHPPPLVTRDVNIPFRRGRTSTMQARKRMTLSPRQRAVSSKACARTWMGEYVFEVCILLLTLAQVWFCTCVHCQSCQNHNGVITHLDQGHATAQTTGLGGHMAARFIPTVERESIDLV